MDTPAMLSANDAETGTQTSQQHARNNVPLLWVLAAEAPAGSRGSSWRISFRFLVGKLTLGKFRSQSLGFPLSATIPLTLHIHSSITCSVYSGPVTCLNFRRHIPSPLKEQNNKGNVARSRTLYTSSSDNLTSWHETIRSEWFYGHLMSPATINSWDFLDRFS